MLRRLLGDVRPHGRYALGIIGCTLLYAAARVGPPLLARTLLDSTLRGHAAVVLSMTLSPATTIAAIPAMILALAGIMAGAQYLIRVWAAVLGQRLVANLQVRLFEHLLRLPMSTLEHKAVGRHLVRFGGDMGAVRRVVSRSAPEILRDMLALAAIGSTLFHLSPSLAAPIAGVVVVYGLTAFGAVRRLQRASRVLRASRARIAGMVVDRLAGAEAVKLARRERAEARRVARAQKPVLDATARAAQQGAVLHAAAEVAVGVAVAVSLGLGTRAVFAGTLSRGEMVAFYGLALMIFAPLRTVGRSLEALAHGRVALDRLYAVLDQPRERDQTHAQPLQPNQGRISVRGLRTSESVVPDLTLEPGVTALVGARAARTANLGQLLVRLRDAEAGEVTVDGMSIADATLDSLRRAIAYIPFPPDLLKGSLTLNLRAGGAAAGDDALLHALRNIGALWADDASCLRMQVGSSGRRMTALQRWQVLCARATLSPPAIVILDGVPFDGDALDEVLQNVLRAGTRSIVLLVDQPLRSASIARTADVGSQAVPTGA